MKETNRYVGNRYVPKIMGEWNQLETYEGLSIVTNSGNSYTSKKRVPVGIELLNEDYWVSTGNYNAQIEAYRKEVRDQKVDMLASFKQLGTMILNETDLETKTSIKDTFLIGQTINITKDITLSSKGTLHFNQNGKLVIKDGVTVTLDMEIEAGFHTIFIFEGTGKIVAKPTDYGTLLNRTSIDYKVKAEWFGVVGDAFPSSRYLYEDLSFANGTDSTQAFKKCMAFIESGASQSGINPNRHISPTAILSLKPNVSYKIKGDNPLGVQSIVKDIAYSIKVEGNGSTLLWEALTINDAIFNKYGRIAKPDIQDLNVVCLGQKGRRWGSFISSKTNEGDTFHNWNGGIFKNLTLGTHESVGFNTIFNIQTDVTHSHDDLTLCENVKGFGYNCFYNFENKESVNWLILKGSFVSNTDNSTHIKLADNHSGGLTVDSPDILIRQANETFLEVGESVSSTPIRLINGRMETRNSLPFIFIKAKSGNTIVNNVQFQTGNTEDPNINTRTAVLSEKAYIRFEDCKLYDQFDLKISSLGGQKNTALEFKQTSFLSLIRGTKRTLGYPTLNYLVNDIQKTISEVIKSGLPLRKVIVENPTITDGGLLLPIEYGTRSSNEKSKKIELFKLNETGKPTINLTGIVSLPPNIKITSIKLFMKGVDPLIINQVNIQAYEDRELPSGNATDIVHTITENKDLKGLELLPDKLLSLPNRNYINMSLRLNNTVVSTNLPVSWLEIEYSALSKGSDFLEDSTKFGSKDILTVF